MEPGYRHPTGKSSEQRLNLSRSSQQGDSTTYNTVFEPSRLQGIYPNERVELSCTDEPSDMLLGADKPRLLLVG
jgi:hypothetical protein